MQPEQNHQPEGELLKQDTIFQEQYKINQNVALLEHAEEFWMNECKNLIYLIAPRRESLTLLGSISFVFKVLR